MFPLLRARLGTALDLVVEFSTLGEYRLDAQHASFPVSVPPTGSDRAPQLGGAGDHAARAAVRRTVAGEAAGATPAATPAARRLAAGRAALRPCAGCAGRRHAEIAARPRTRRPGIAG